MNPRLILLENLRQSCIYSEYFTLEPQKYWKYMITFSDTCLDLGKINFTEECSKSSLDLVGIDEDKIKTCMINNINNGKNRVFKLIINFR